MTYSHSKNIFSSTRHFTHDELIRFHHHLLTGEELHELERHLIDCQLCSEALKGVAEMENSSLLFEVSKELHVRARRKKLLKRTIFSQHELTAIIAIVFLILFLLLMSIFFFSKQGNNKIPNGENKIEGKK